MFEMIIEYCHLNLFLIISGLYLATCSGDGTVKIWDFTKNQCMLTLSEHIQPGKRFSCIYYVVIIIIY